MKRFKDIVAVVIILCLFSIGCSAYKKAALKESDRVSLQSVSISNDIEIPDKVFIESGQGTNLSGSGFGLVGVLVDTTVDSYNRSKVEKMQQIIESKIKNSDSDVDIRQMLQNRFLSELREADLFGNKIVSEGGDAEFKLSIHSYGFKRYYEYEKVEVKDDKGGVKEETKTQLSYIPILQVDASLIRKDGSVLWKEFAEGVDNNFKFQIDEYNSELIGKAFASVSQTVAKILIDKMKNEKSSMNIDVKRMLKDHFFKP
jgi:hypothetical protein